MPTDRPMQLRAILVAAVIALCMSSTAVATPFVPSDDAEVLERLPLAPFDPSAKQLQSLRRELSEQPGSVALATRVAWRYIEHGRSRSDPRYYGYAQAALAPWWRLPQPPVAVLVLRATLHQHDHDFETALADLSRALEADPQNAQAWLTRALVEQVRGEYAAAQRSCQQVLQVSSPLVGVICASSVGSLSGAATQSYGMLRSALQRDNDANLSLRQWALTLLAEIAMRTGHPQLGEAHFKQALALDRRDEYLLGAYADFLLDRNRPAAVVPLLQDETRADALLLRLAIAEGRIGSAEAEAHGDALRARFAAGHLRGEVVHRREEARFALECLRQPRQALGLARDNWEVQREPWDARLLLAAAVAASEPTAAQPVLDFLSRTGLEDVELARLSTQVRPGRP